MTMALLEMRDAFIDTIYQSALEDRDIVFVSVEYGAPSLDRFRENLPDQFINVGICEQNAISVAAGLSLKGKKVFVYSIASFITLRCLEQVKIDICAMHLPVTILGVGPCYAYSADGPTHHATEDVALFRALSGMAVYTSSDANMAEALAQKALCQSSPLYIRLDKGKYHLHYGNRDRLSEGYRVLRPGNDVVFVTTGVMTHEALVAAGSLEEAGKSCAVLDLYRAKPIDREQLANELRQYSRIVTVEEHTLNGGIGSVVAEIVAEEQIWRPFRRVAVEDASLYDYGLRPDMHRKRGLDADSLTDMILAWDVNDSSMEAVCNN